MSAKPQSRVIDSPWMRTDECATYMKFPSTDAFYKWLRTPAGQKLPRGNRGPRTLMFDRRIVDAFMAGLLKESAKPSKRVLRIVNGRSSAVAAEHDASVNGGSDAV